MKSYSAPLRHVVPGSIFARGSVSWVACVAALSVAACTQAPAAPDAAPPIEVQVATLKPEPIRDARDFIGSLSSRRAVMLQSQATGYISRILVKPGDQVAQDQVLIVLDASRDEAALNNLVALKASREANRDYAKLQSERTKELVGSGVISQQSAEQADSSARAAEADLNAIDAQIRAQQAQLRYFRITAPTAGKVGEIPVKVGDFITPGVSLTAVVQDAALEANVTIPIDLATKLSPDTFIELLDDRGATKVSSKVSFVSPNVDPDTQTVLVKSVFANKDELRSAQFVRARVVFSEAPGLRLPVSAAQRMAGQYFAFVVQQGPALTVKQVPVRLGDIIDNAFVVTSGLKDGDQVVTLGIEKLSDGAAIALAAKKAD